MKIPKYIPINQMDPLFQVSRSLFWFNLFYRYSNQMVVLVLFYTLLWFGHLDVYIILHYIIYKHTHIHIHIHIHIYIYIYCMIFYMINIPMTGVSPHDESPPCWTLTFQVKMRTSWKRCGPRPWKSSVPKRRKVSTRPTTLSMDWFKGKSTGNHQFSH